MANGLISKMFGSGLRVDRAPSKKKKRSVWVPPAQTHGEGQYQYYQQPFYGGWEKPIGAGVKKKLQKGKRDSATGKKSPFNSIPILGSILLNFKLGNL